MDKKLDHPTPPPTDQAHRWQTAELLINSKQLTTGTLLVTTTPVAAMEPKIPPLVGD